MARVSKVKELLEPVSDLGVESEDVVSLVRRLVRAYGVSGVAKFEKLEKLSQLRQVVVSELRRVERDE